MKKLLTIVLLSIFALSLSACGGNQVSGNEEQIIFSFPEEDMQYLPYDYGEVPNFILKFEGNINTVIGATTTNKKVFSKNDDFILSDILSELFEEYTLKNRITIRLINEEVQYETRMNSLVENSKGELAHKGHILRVVDGKVYNELAFINLENGLTLSAEYRRFASIVDDQVKMFYAWRYPSPLNMVLHYPLIVNVKSDGKKELLLVPTPPKVIYRVGVSQQLPLSTVVTKDSYLQDHYKTFFYPEYSDDPRYEADFDLDENIEFVKDFYKFDFNGHEEDGEFYFSYLGKTFVITFGEVSFQIDYSSTN